DIAVGLVVYVRESDGCGAPGVEDVVVKLVFPRRASPAPDDALLDRSGKHSDRLAIRNQVVSDDQAVCSLHKETCPAGVLQAAPGCLRILRAPDHVVVDLVLLV